MSKEETLIDLSGEMQPVESEKNKIFEELLKNQFQLPQAQLWVQERRKNIRPWLVFVQTSNFRAPQSLTRISRRVMKNLDYFLSNYCIVILILCAYCLITTPLLLLTVCGALYLNYKLSLRTANIKIFGKELNKMQQQSLLMACSVPVFYLVGATQALFWTSGASLVIIGLHAIFYNIDNILHDPENEFLTENV